jgi:hypothetical protein
MKPVIQRSAHFSPRTTNSLRLQPAYSTLLMPNHWNLPWTNLISISWEVQFKFAPPRARVMAACLALVLYSLVNSNGMSGARHWYCCERLRNSLSLTRERTYAHTHARTHTYILNKCVHRSHTFYIRNQTVLTQCVVPVLFRWSATSSACNISTVLSVQTQDKLAN